MNNNLGNVYLHKEMYDDAIDHFQVAISLQPNDTLIRYHLSLAYLRASEFSNAETSLRELIRVDPTYWVAYHRLGEVLIALDKKDEAQSVLESLLEANPNYSGRAEVESILADM